MKHLLITIMIAFLLIGFIGIVKADLVSDALDGINGIIEGAKDIINLDKSSTTISLSSKAKEVYEGKNIKAVEINGTTNKRVFELKANEEYLTNLEVKTKKCSQRNWTINRMCDKYEQVRQFYNSTNLKGQNIVKSKLVNSTKCIKYGRVLSRRDNGCLVYVDKSKEEILSDIDSKSKFALENRVAKSINNVNGLNIEREIRI